MRHKFTCQFKLLILLLVGLFAAGELLAQSPRSRNAPVFNVAVEGRHQPGDDITITLQRGLDTHHIHKMPIYIPGGRWKSSEIVLPYRSGIKIEGAATGNAVGAGHVLTGGNTILQYSGGDSGVMFTVTGQDVIINDLTLIGTTNWTDDATPATGANTAIHVRRPDGSSGLGTGNVIGENLTFVNFNEALWFGENNATSNSDRTTWRWVRFRNCDTSVLVDDDQAMQHKFYHCEIENSSPTNLAFVVDAGGHVDAEDMLMFAGTLLTVNGTTSSVGRNNGMFRFSFGKWDSTHSDDLQLVQSNNPGVIGVFIDGWNQSHTDQPIPTAFIDIQGRNHVELNNWRGRYGPIVGTEVDDYVPSVLIRGGRYYSGTEQKARDLISGDIQVHFRDFRSEVSHYFRDMDIVKAADVTTLFRLNGHTKHNGTWYDLLFDEDLVGRVPGDGNLRSALPDVIDPLVLAPTGTPAYTAGPPALNGPQATVVDPAGVAGINGLKIDPVYHALSTAHSVAGWFRQDGTATTDEERAGLICKDGSGPGGGGDNWGITFHETDGLKLGQSVNYTLYNQAYTSGEWVHVALVLDSGATNKATFYINGTQVYTDQTFLVTSFKGLWFGRDERNNRTLDGAMADLWVFDRALTAAEVLALYEGEP